MPVTINGTTGVVFPDGVTQGSGVPTASGTSGAPLVSNGTIYTQNTAVAVAFGGTGATSNSAARTNLGLGTIATQDANNVTITGGSITGANLSGATAINASNITSGTVATARLASGTANSSTYLRGDQTWSTVSGGVTSVATGNGLSGGTITTTGTLIIACPTFNSIGSYVDGAMRLDNGNSVTATAGSNYSAGGGNGQVGSRTQNSQTPINNLTGTWKWMAGTFSGSQGACCGPTKVDGILCRVS